MERKSLSESEKKKQEKKLKKEEKKREKELKKKLRSNEILRDYLKREENRNKICLERSKNEIEKWIESLALEDLKLDVLTLTKSLDRIMDKSSHAIETIENHRDHADEQYYRNFQIQCKMIDHIEGTEKKFKDSKNNSIFFQRFSNYSEIHQCKALKWKRRNLWKIFLKKI